MYAEAGMFLPLMPSLTQEASATQHNLLLNTDENFLSSSLSNVAPDVGNLVQSSTISEYDLGVDLFKAPEPILESLLSLEPLVNHEVIANIYARYIATEDLLSEAFYNCKNDLLEKSVIIELPAELHYSNLHSHNIEDSEVSLTRTVPTDYLLSEVFDGCEKELLATPAISIASPREPVVEDPALQMEEYLGVSKTISIADGALQKSVSLGCISPAEEANSCSIRPFLDFHELEAAFVMRRAFSEGDIQILGNNHSVHGNTSIFPSSFTQLSTIGNATIDEKIEERWEKLSRYRKKRTKRNFDRKIKYACRKALADSQPRIRGRFARTEK